MTSDLFPDCRQDSPRLAWMKRHGVEVVELPVKQDGQYPFCAGTASLMHAFGYGDTEDDALADFAKRNGIPLWNEEQYAKEK